MRWRTTDQGMRRMVGLICTVGGSVLLALVVPAWLWSGLLAAVIIWLGVTLWRT